MSYNARKELVLSVALRYYKVDRNKKMKILDEFTAATGYHRKYAILLLRQFKPTQTPKTLPKKPHRNIKYNEEVQNALIQIWEAANRICSKRLVPYLPELIEVMSRHGYLKLDPQVHSKLLKISPATVDRILAKSRDSKHNRGLSTTRSGYLLKRNIPIRTFFDWKETEPGFIEADLVAHCGTSVQGSYVHTLVMTDIATGWTEPTAIPYRLSNLPERLRKSMTYDQGRELSHHESFSAISKASVYFCDPHSPWQRGTNENTNGLLRQYFPKGTDFNNVPHWVFEHVEHELNERPRKVLDFQSPKEAFTNLVALET